VEHHAADSEIELARELIAGNANALERFIEVFQGKVFQYSYLMCGQRDDAEEVAQETLMKVFESFGQLREPEHVKTWVFRIARNNCLMKRRKSVFAPAEELALDDMTYQAADTGETADAQVFRGELREALEAAIRRLPPIYRAVVLLRDVEDLTTEQAADILGVSVDVVKTRLHRARRALRQALEPALANEVTK
jgi:RNA polymerase sigma-70 factor (ECF subfamily)